MTKELQDQVWSVLPKEFKEYIIKVYKATLECSISDAHFLENIFGKHNLTSESEGEVELLHVTQQKVMGLYANAKKLYYLYTNATCINEAESRTIDSAAGTMRVLKNLFGSKCLPDKVDSLDPNVDSLKPKPAELKYHKGEKVRYNGYVYEVEGLVGKNRYALKGLNFDLDEDMIEPYTESQDAAPSICSGTVDLSAEKSFCSSPEALASSNFKNNELRLQIAAQIAQGALSNPNVTKSCADFETNLEYITKTALMYADALIAECELSSHQLSPVKKGGSHEKA